MCDDCPSVGLNRRTLMLAGAAAVTAAPLITNAQAQPVSAVDTPEAALAQLIEGNARYVANQPRQRLVLQDAQAGHKVKHHSRQSSAARILRIAPELAFDQNPGDLFVVRVAGQLRHD